MFRALINCIMWCVLFFIAACFCTVVFFGVRSWVLDPSAGLHYVSDRCTRAVIAYAPLLAAGAIALSILGTITGNLPGSRNRRKMLAYWSQNPLNIPADAPGHH